MAIVTVYRIDGGRPRERGARNAGTPAVEQDARRFIAPAQLRRGVGTRDCREARARPCRGDADQVEQAARRLLDDIRRKIGECDPADERRDIGIRGRPRSRRGAIIGHQMRPFAFRKPSATSSTVFLSTSTLALSLDMFSSLSFAESAFSASAIFGFLSRISLRTTGVRLYGAA